ncbi:hypothetical protein [Flagellimonas beolgyonensis]|uniref:hypothetical protein n=1 Tax=Flagellimonas beolgyonensis TaxID=864064 RepID=UPI003D65BEAE
MNHKVQINDKITRLLVVSFFVLIGCESPYLKQDALKQSYICLKIKNDLGRLSNERKPYFFLMAKSIEEENEVSDSTINSIKRISSDINRKLATYKKMLQELKTNHKDSRFIDATLQFIEIDENLESQNGLLVNSLLNPESDMDIRKQLAENLKIAMLKMTEFQDEFKTRESKFHSDNSIFQKEVDSIVDVINREVDSIDI